MPEMNPSQEERSKKAENMPSAAQSSELLKIVVEEVDEAREVLELAQQLVSALPLRSLDDVTKAVKGGRITFRGRSFDPRGFAALVPSILFPIDDVRKLVTVLYETVRLAPPSVKYSDTDPAQARRRLHRLGILGALGRIGQMGPPSIGLPSQTVSYSATPKGERPQ